MVIILQQGCNQWGAGVGAAGEAMPRTSVFQTKQGPIVSVSNIRDIAFYVCSEIIRIRILQFSPTFCRSDT